eukprot:s3353_g2.t1
MPALYNWTWASCFAFLGYVLITGNDSIVKAWSKGRSRKDFPYAVSSVMLLSGITSFIIGILAAGVIDKKEGLKKCFNPKAICRVGCVNVFFQLAGILKFKALTRVPPDAVSILSQMNLFLLALAIRVVMNKFFSFAQWLCLAMICNGVILYMISREGQLLHQVVASLCLCSVVAMYTWKTWKARRGMMEISLLMLLLLWILAAMTLIGSVWQALPQSSLQQPANGLRSADVWWGCLDILGMCCCESFASVFLERYFKNDDQEHCNFYIQKVHVDCSSILFSSILFGMSKSTAGFPTTLSDIMVLPGALFAGWDSSTVVVLLLMVCKAWLAGLVAKMLDSVVKQIGSCTAIALMFVEMNCWERFATVGTTSSVGIIVLAILNFTTLSRSQRDDQGWTSEPSAFDVLAQPAEQLWISLPCGDRLEIVVSRLAKSGPLNVSRPKSIYRRLLLDASVLRRKQAKHACSCTTFVPSAVMSAAVPMHSSSVPHQPLAARWGLTQGTQMPRAHCEGLHASLQQYRRSCGHTCRRTARESGLF